MKMILRKLKLFLARLRAFFPSRLPIGMTEFDKWSQSVIDLYSLPDNDSTRFALATMILHVDSLCFHKSKRYFGLMTLKSMSNQVAAGVMQDLKQKQADMIKAAMIADESQK